MDSELIGCIIGTMGISQLPLSFSMWMQEARYLEYYSDTLGLSEVDLSKVIGVLDGRLVWGGSDFGAAVDARSVILINAHVLTAEVGGVGTWLDLNERIRLVDEVLTYREEAFGSPDDWCICCPWRFSK